MEAEADDIWVSGSSRTPFCNETSIKDRLLQSIKATGHNQTELAGNMHTMTFRFLLNGIN